MITRLGRAYARAFLETTPAPELAPAVAQLHTLVAALEAVPRLAGMARNPAVPMAVKERVLVAVSEQLAIAPRAQQLLRLLLANYRLGRLPEVVEAIEELVRRRHGIAAVGITSASDLDESERAMVRAVLERGLGQAVELSFAVEPKLIAGFVARIGSRRYDTSVRGQLERLARELAAAALQQA